MHGLTRTARSENRELQNKNSCPYRDSNSRPLILKSSALSISPCSPIYKRQFKTYLDKKEEIWLSPMTKAPTATETSKGAVKTQTTPQKSSIKQRLRTDLRRSVGVTTATQLVWLTWFTGPTFPLPATTV